jgi:acyl-coenzyme A synthetase/AMP-(fatty) acid ligase/acyl carrier protein
LNEVRKLANAQVLAGAGTGHDAAASTIAAQILRHKASHLQCTPSLARMLLLDQPTRASLAGIRHLLVGGEALPAALAKELKTAVGGELRNMYGPTETTVWSAIQPVESGGGPVPIGRPIANTQLYVLDACGHPVPAGVPGELFIGGAGVTRGYLHQPERTLERFTANPFHPSERARVYRTGDLARRQPDGAIEFLGRVDHQVKIRGHRVELEEIERLLGTHPGVAQSAVVLHGAAGEELRLVAHVVAAAGTRPGAADLREWLARQLPDYMVPSDFVALDRLPLTPNGKLDRKALPAPDGTAAQVAEFVAPESPTERVLAAQWRELLKLDRIGAHDNFFELGGHSLLAMQAIFRVREAMSLDLPLRELFASPTISKLSARIEVLRSERHWAAPLGSRETITL